MLMCGIINELKNEMDNTANIPFFFCQAADERINNATSVLRGLIYLIIDQQPSLLPHVRKRYDKTGKQLFEDANAWHALCDILSDILEDPTLYSTYFLVDALDECLTDLPKLLKFISELSSSGISHIKWIISGRNSLVIEDCLDYTSEKIRLSLELNEASVSEAVTVYIQQKVQELTKKKMYNSDTREAVHQHLLANAQGTFLWVALVYEELQKARPWRTLKLLTAFPPGLDPLYIKMLEKIQDSEDANICNSILATVSVVYRPIGLTELSTLVDLPNEVHGEFLAELIASCGSFLTLRGDQIFFIHQSAKDFLVERASSRIFPRGVAAEHSAIVSRSLPIMLSTLRRNMYGLRNSFQFLEYAPPQKPNPNPLDAIQYPCVFWVNHLQDAYFADSVGFEPHHWELVEIFLREKFLNWIEAMCLLESAERAIEAILYLEELVQVG